MSGRIIKMRSVLYDALVKLNTPGDWNHIKTQIGMFCSYKRTDTARAMPPVSALHAGMLQSLTLGLVSRSLSFAFCPPLSCCQRVSTRGNAHIASCVRVVPVCSSACVCWCRWFFSLSSSHRSDSEAVRGPVVQVAHLPPVERTHLDVRYQQQEHHVPRPGHQRCRRQRQVSKPTGREAPGDRLRREEDAPDQGTPNRRASLGRRVWPRRRVHCQLGGRRSGGSASAWHCCSFG